LHGLWTRKLASTLALASILLLAAGARPPREPYARITDGVGIIKLRKLGGRTWERIRKINHPVDKGDTLKTGKESRAEITFFDGIIVRIGEKTAYTILDIGEEEESLRVRSRVLWGKVWVNIKTLTEKRADFRIDSPTAATSIRGTVYRMTATDTLTVIRVYRGEVGVRWPPPLGKRTGVGGKGRKRIEGPRRIQGPKQITAEEWYEVVKALQELVVKANGTRVKSSFSLDEDMKDEWVRWNMERDGI